MKIEVAVAVAVSLIAVTSAHLCLVSPQQRGSINGLNKAGRLISYLLYYTVQNGIFSLLHGQNR